MRIRSILITACLLMGTEAAQADPEAIRNAILGEGPASGEMDLNQDGAVDVADLVMDVQDDVEISLDDRWALIELAAEQFESLGSLPLAEKNAAMAAWLLEQPLIKAAGIDTDVVWAYFLDGLPIMFADNRLSSGGPAPAKVILPLETERFSSRPSQVRAPQEEPQGPGEPHPEWYDADQPGSQHVLFLDIFESGYDSIEISAHIRQRLEEVGYSLGSVSTDPDPTMADFKAQVQDLGLFFITTHGGKGLFEDVVASIPVVGDYYAFQSPIILTKEKFAALAETDVINKRLIPMGGSVVRDENGDTTKVAVTWGITDLFIEHYFSFASNSLSFIDACNSDDEAMRAALVNSGAAMIIDWDNTVDSGEAAQVEDVLFRRMIGSDQIVDEFLADDEFTPVDDSSPVRPFDFDSVWNELDRLGRLQDSNGTNLTFHREEDSDFALLVPAIRSMQVYGADGTLHLYGLFGANPGAGGKVFVDDVSMSIQSWDIWEIVIDLPPRAHGEVYVSKNGIKGNKIALSLYEGMGSAQFVSPAPQNFANANFTINFRGDFSPFRVKPDDEPIYWKSQEFMDYAVDPEFPKFVTRYVEFPLGLSHVAYLDGVSEISYSFGGELDNISCEDPGVISGAGTLPVILTNPTFEPPEMVDGFLGATELDLFLNSGVKTWIIGLDTIGSIGTYSNAGCESHDGEMVNLISSGLKAVDIHADFGPDGTVLGNAFVSPEISPFGYTFTTSLTLPTMPPQPAPDPSVYPD